MYCDCSLNFFNKTGANLLRALLRARTVSAAVAGATVVRRPADVSSSRTNSGKPSAACGTASSTAVVTKSLNPGQDAAAEAGGQQSRGNV